MAYKTQSHDTSFKVERLLIEAYRCMTPHEKAKKYLNSLRRVRTSQLRAFAVGIPKQMIGKFAFASARCAWIDRP